MLKILLVIVYLYSGEVRTEMKSFDNMEACVEKGVARIEALQLDPKFDMGLYANCVPSLVTEAQK